MIQRNNKTLSRDNQISSFPLTDIESPKSKSQEYDERLLRCVIDLQNKPKFEDKSPCKCSSHSSRSEPLGTPVKLSSGSAKKCAGESNKTPESYYKKKKHVFDLKEFSCEVLKAGGIDKASIYGCGKPLPNKTAIDIYKTGGADNPSANFSGQKRCGSLWTCPECSMLITLRRQKEVQDAVEKAQKLGLKVLFATMTAPHDKRLSSKNFVSRMKSASAFIYNGGSGALFQEKYGIPMKKYSDEKGHYVVNYIHRITAQENTYGQNGLHYHYHVLLFVDQKCDVPAFKADLFERWREGCDTFGLIPKNRTKAFKEHALDLVEPKDSQQAAQYVTKGDPCWTISKEITRGQDKQAKTSSSMTPFQILNTAFEAKKNNDKETFDRMSKLYVDYAKTIKGSKHLRWSKHFKSFLSVVDKDDEEIANEEDYSVEKEYVCSINIQVYMDLMEKRLLADVLTIVAFEGRDALDKFLEKRGYRKSIYIDRDSPPKAA